MDIEDKETDKIVIHYDNGEIREFTDEKAAVISIGDEKEDGAMDISFDMLNIKGKDLRLIVMSILEFAVRLGMFNESEVDE